MSDAVNHYTEELIVTLQGLYNRQPKFTWGEARPLLAKLLSDFKAQQRAAPELEAEVKRLQEIVDRYEFRAAINGENGAALRMADAEGVKN